MDIVRCTDVREITKFQTLLQKHHRQFDKQFFAAHILPYQQHEELEEVWVAKDGIFNLGYIHISNPKRGRLHIAGLYVHPHYRNRCVGTALISHAIERAAVWGGIDSITLSAYVDNTEAIALYKRLGFVPRYVALYKEVH